jgi:hypothetical protein
MRLNESPVLAAIADALGRDPLVLVRRRHVGTFIAVSGPLSAAIEILRRHGIAARPIDVGVLGEPDLDVIVGGQVCAACGAPVHPRPVGLEVKSATGAERPSQAVYREHVAARRGIPHAVVRSPIEAALACGISLEVSR